MPADLSRLVQARHARVVPLVAARASSASSCSSTRRPRTRAEIASVADLAAAMLSLVDRHDQVDESVRVFPPRHFRTVADRMLTLASRHDRRASVLAITLPGADRPNRREEATLEIADIVRNTDALCGTEDGDLLVFLPETAGIGAHSCRRRILARLSGDRRARSKSAATRTQEPRSKGAAGRGRRRDVPSRRLDAQAPHQDGARARPRRQPLAGPHARARGDDAPRGRRRADRTAHARCRAPLSLSARRRRLGALRARRREHAARRCAAERPP